LETFPLSGRIVPDVGDANVRELVEGSYRIIYHILEEQVDVIAVVHSSQKWPPE
jgi:plasmid stabilization system protein ParE